MLDSRDVTQTKVRQYVEMWGRNNLEVWGSRYTESVLVGNYVANGVVIPPITAFIEPEGPSGCKLPRLGYVPKGRTREEALFDIYCSTNYYLLAETGIKFLAGSNYKRTSIIRTKYFVNHATLIPKSR